MVETFFLVGDCRETLTELLTQSVQCVVTSPPYYGLRDYGTALWEGGDPSCTHSGRQVRSIAPSASSTLRGNGHIGGGPKAHAVASLAIGDCVCGARRRDHQIGLEKTPDAYVAELVAVFREVRRVLRDDGTLWLVIGDSYAGGGGFSPGAPSNLTSKSGLRGERCLKVGGIKPTGDLKPKDLLGIPWMVAFALRADGWYLRSDVIWHKPNCMPESVTDRPTSAHEHVFLFAKSERYFYDAAAIAEPSICVGRQHSTVVQPPKVRALQESGHHGKGGNLSINYERETRNARNVWTIATRPYPGAHFATYPPDLAEKCILAGSRPGDIVLDPFAGAGTTGLVAYRTGRHAILCELNAGYVDLARARISKG